VNSRANTPASTPPVLPPRAQQDVVLVETSDLAQQPETSSTGMSSKSTQLLPLTSVNIPVNKFVTIANNIGMTRSSEERSDSTSTMTGSNDETRGMHHQRHHSEPEVESQNMLSSWEEDMTDPADDIPPFDSTNLISFADGVCLIALELCAIILKILVKGIEEERLVFLFLGRVKGEKKMGAHSKGSCCIEV